MNAIAPDLATMRRYHMHPQSYLCEVAEGGVVLDLRKNRYIALSQFQMQALGAVVSGWPNRTETTVALHDAEAVAREFAQLRLLTEDPVRGKDATPIEAPLPEARLVDLDVTSRPPRMGSYFGALAASSALAWVLLKGCPLSYVIHRVQRRKQQLPSNVTFDLARARAAMQAFFWLRPLFYTAKDHCLYDCVVLVEFMAHYGLYPTWIIGVKRFAPFMAHSWVQYRGYAFDGSPENLRAFVPILAV
jgi:hypothetical protein